MSRIKDLWTEDDVGLLFPLGLCVPSMGGRTSIFRLCKLQKWREHSGALLWIIVRTVRAILAILSLPEQTEQACSFHGTRSTKQRLYLKRQGYETGDAADRVCRVNRG